jgi:hypothetical protein
LIQIRITTRREQLRAVQSWQKRRAWPRSGVCSGPPLASSWPHPAGTLSSDVRKLALALRLGYAGVHPGASTGLSRTVPLPAGGSIRRGLCAQLCGREFRLSSSPGSPRAAMQSWSGSRPGGVDEELRVWFWKVRLEHHGRSRRAHGLTALWCQCGCHLCGMPGEF